MTQPPASLPPRLRSAILVTCGGLLLSFAVLSFSAALTKSATFDEPFHALAGWIKLHLRDFQMDYESLPLATEWAQLLNPRSALQFDETSEDWTKLSDNPYRGFNLATTTLFRTRGNDGATFINQGRFMMMLLGVGMGALIIGWSWKIAGPLAGLAGAVLYCLDPNMLGHASLVKTDIAVSFAMAGTIYLTWSVGREVRIKNALMLAVVMGVAMNTKFSAVLLWPMVVFLLGVRAIVGRDWMVLGQKRDKVSGRLVTAVALVGLAGGMTVFVTWTAHGFRFGPSPDPTKSIRTESYRYELILDRYREQHPRLGKVPSVGELDQEMELTQRSLDGATSIPHETRIRLQLFIDRAKQLRAEIGPATLPTSAAATAPVDRGVEAAAYQLGFVEYFVAQPPEAPDRMVAFGEFLLRYRLMPSAWTHGLMVQYARSNILDSYLLGKVRSSGTWYFFPLAILVKSPVMEVIALVTAIGFGAWLVRSRWGSRARWGWSAGCILFPPIAFLGMAMVSSLNIGLRHVFPIYPFMLIAAAIAWGVMISRAGLMGRRVAIGLAVVLLAETSLAWPNYIAHFNVVARTWPGSLYLLGDSNLDWGQDLPALRDWQKAHPGRKIALAYFGMTAPEFYGIDAEPLPAWPPPADLLRTHVLAISATHLQGITDRRYSGYQQLAPAEVLGGTIYLYYDRPVGR